jgi:hypothetical protein
MAGIHMGIASSTESRSSYRKIYFPGREDGMAHRSAASADGRSLLIVEMNGGTWLSCRFVPADVYHRGHRSRRRRLDHRAGSQQPTATARARDGHSGPSTAHLAKSSRWAKIAIFTGLKKMVRATR